MWLWLSMRFFLRQHHSRRARPKSLEHRHSLAGALRALSPLLVGPYGSWLGLDSSHRFPPVTAPNLTANRVGVKLTLLASSDASQADDSVALF